MLLLNSSSTSLIRLEHGFFSTHETVFLILMKVRLTKLSLFVCLFLDFNGVEKDWRKPSLTETWRSRSSL